MQRVRRADLIFADYNPRDIDDSARKRLRDNLKSVGLLEPIIWNKRSGNVVSGHQRLEQVDSLHKGTSYLLDVAAVDLDEAAERALAIFLNNGLAQGTWDVLKLQDSIRGLDVSKCGFADFELQVILPAWTPAPKVSEVSEVSESLEVVLVFKDRAETDRFMTLLNLPVDEKYIAGELVAEAIGVATETS